MGGSSSPAWTGVQVRDRFNAIPSILYYTRAAHSLGVWESERILIERFLPGRDTRIVEAGCGSGRVTLALWKMGYGNISAFDFADELLDQAQSLAKLEGAHAIRFKCADATRIGRPDFALEDGDGFGAALMMFNGLMQIPGRRNRAEALRRLHSLCLPGAPLIFTTHDRDEPKADKARWEAEALKWQQGTRDPRLPDFGDRIFENESGEVFIHIPDRGEILADLAGAGWTHRFDAMRSEVAVESRAVSDFSDECRFWVAERGS
jgi:SAM-dependent methyltransferase